MNNYDDNLICGGLSPTIDKLEKEILETYPKADGWIPFETYDMIQCGYPYPNHGEMVCRRFGGTNAKNELLPSKGMWCKVEDAMKIINQLNNILQQI